MPEKKKRVRKAKPVVAGVVPLEELIPDTNSMVTLSYNRGETRTFDYNSSRFDVGLSITCHVTNLPEAAVSLANQVETMLIQRMMGPKDTAKVEKHECKGDCKQQSGSQAKETLQKMGITGPEPPQEELPLGDLSGPAPSEGKEIIPDEI